MLTNVEKQASLTAMTLTHFVHKLILQPVSLADGGQWWWCGVGYSGVEFCGVSDGDDGVEFGAGGGRGRVGGGVGVTVGVVVVVFFCFFLRAV